MEEDIEIIENSYVMKTNHELDENNKRLKQAIENLIKRNKELEEENKILNNKQTKVIADSFHEKMAEKFNEDFIPKSKVIEKIEEIKDEELNFNENDYWIEQEMKGYAIDHLQELLQEGDTNEKM